MKYSDKHQLKDRLGELLRILPAIQFQEFMSEGCKVQYREYSQ